MKSLPFKSGVILIGMSIIVFISICECSFAQTEYSCNSIERGMREDDVLRVLGFPHDRRPDFLHDKRRSFDSSAFSGIWIYNRYGKLPLNIFFFDGKVTNCQD